MRNLIAVAALSIVACSASLDAPKYSTKIESAGGDTYAIHVETQSTMDEDDLKRALLTEAARATIDRGAIYLVVHEVTNEGTVVNVKEKTGADPVPPQSPSSTEQGMKSEVSFSRQRNGTIRFTTFREMPAGARVYDASQLLDRLKRGEMPE